MASEKLTITLPAAVVREVRKSVKKRGGTVSSYVANAVSTFERLFLVQAHDLDCVAVGNQSSNGVLATGS